MGLINHLSAEPGTQVYTTSAIPLWEGTNEYLASTMSRANPIRVSSLIGKEKDVSKIFFYISHHEEQRQTDKPSKIKA